jgi:hypothetical protein
VPLAAQEVPGSIIPNLIAPNIDGTRVSVTVDRGLTSDKQLRSSALRKARMALRKGGEVSAKDLRALAEAGDGLAAQRYVRVLTSADTSPNMSDLAFFSAVAVGSGRIWTLRTMIDALHQLDPKTEPPARVRKYIQVLYPHAWAGNTLAMEAVVAFNGEGRLFGPLSERTRGRILASAIEHGNGRIEFGIAMALLERARATETPDPEDLANARSLLKQAMASDHLAVSTSARNLLRLMDNPKTDGS